MANLVQSSMFLIGNKMDCMKLKPIKEQLYHYTYFTLYVDVTSGMTAETSTTDSSVVSDTGVAPNTTLRLL